MVSVTQSLRYARLAGKRIFLAFTSALHAAIASLIIRSSASDSVAAAEAAMDVAPYAKTTASIAAHKLLVKQGFIC
jgi:hypothetical protein